jgi:hypothetical protein
MSKIRTAKEPSRRTLIAATGAAVAAGVSLPLLTASSARADEPKVMLMFVQTSDDLKVDPAAQTMRLVNVGKQTLYFADRPERLAGHMTLADYLDDWTSKAGPNNFAKDPPNATLSVYESGKADNTLAVVTISNPRLDGADLIYSYKLVEGTLPAGGGATALFIDWIGVGGGVGRGFHGVGVGRRGPGVYR